MSRLIQLVEEILRIIPEQFHSDRKLRKKAEIAAEELKAAAEKMRDQPRKPDDRLGQIIADELREGLPK